MSDTAMPLFPSFIKTPRYVYNLMHATGAASTIRLGAESTARKNGSLPWLLLDQRDGFELASK